MSIIEFPQDGRKGVGKAKQEAQSPALSQAPETQETLLAADQKFFTEHRKYITRAMDIAKQFSETIQDFDFNADALNLKRTTLEHTSLEALCKILIDSTRLRYVPLSSEVNNPIIMKRWKDEPYLYHAAIMEIQARVFQLEAIR